jgi:hypothetical protein
MKILIEQLKNTIKEAENNPRDTFYYISSLSTAKGLLSALNNPPKGRDSFVTDNTIIQSMWDLKNSTINEI